MNDGRTDTMQNRLHDHWKGYALQGVLMAIVGMIALAAPMAATLASTLFFGWLLIIGGVLGGAAAFQVWGHAGFWSSLALGILATILGAVIVYNPVAGAVTLTWMMGTFFILSAFMEFALARQITRGGSGRFALILTGIVNLLLAAMLLLGLPGTAVWAVGVYIGISLVFGGIGLLFAALGGRNAPAVH